MANGTDRRSRHFIIEGFAETQTYRSPQQFGSSAVVPQRNRARHAGALQRQVEAVRREADAAREAQQAAGLDDLGLRVEFESFPDIALAFESLARERSGIELLNVRPDGSRTLATVFVPDGRLNHFERLIRDYLEERRDRRGRALDHRKLVDSIRRIRAASLRALWTDEDAGSRRRKKARSGGKCGCRSGRTDRRSSRPFGREPSSRGCALRAATWPFPSAPCYWYPHHWSRCSIRC